MNHEKKTLHFRHLPQVSSLHHLKTPCVPRSDIHFSSFSEKSIVAMDIFFQSYRNEFLISYYDTLRLWHCCHWRKCWVVMSRSISLRVSDIFNSLQITKTIPEQAVSFGWNCCITSKALTNTCMSTNKHK